MAKPRGVEAKIERLKSLREQYTPPEFRSFLGDASNLVVAVAAEIVGERGFKELVPDLLAAFDRFMIEPETTDKHCRAKIALVQALNRLEYEGDAIYLRGIRHVQDPIWQSDDDAASPLRGDCAFGLARIAHPHLLNLLVDLLMDRSSVARRSAVQALGASGRTAAVPLLRLKALTGDPKPEVTAECLTSLMTLAPKESLSFVAKFLSSAKEEIQEGAAFALAESKLSEALPILINRWPNARRSPLEEVVLLAISMFRQSAAIDFVLLILETEPHSALAALNALAIHRHQDAVRERVRAIVNAKNDATLRSRFAKKFEAEG